MEQKVLINHIELTYTPLSNYDFTILREDNIIQQALEKSSLYVIAQRSEMRFDNVQIHRKNESLTFDIRQHNNPSTLKCTLPLFQDYIAKDAAKPVLMYFGSYDRRNKMKKTSLNNIHGIKFYEEEIIPTNFLLWISPEKFINNYLAGALNAKIEGDVRKFMHYKVHYVGQSTKQDVWERLTGHKKLQDILSLEYPFTYGSLPTHEIVLLLFNFKENLQIQTFGVDSDPQEFIDNMMGRNMPEQRTIFLDAEKALIQAMKPDYNDQLFDSYPKSIDGLYKYDYNSISYAFVDPITLEYKNGDIQGASPWGGDMIIIKENKSMELIKADTQ